MPHSRFWRGVSRRVPLFAGLGLAVALLATLVALQALPLQAQTTTVTLVATLFWLDISRRPAFPPHSGVLKSFTTGSDHMLVTSISDGWDTTYVLALTEHFGPAQGGQRQRQAGRSAGDSHQPLAPGDDDVNTFTAPNDRTLAYGEHDLLDNRKRGSQWKCRPGSMTISTQPRTAPTTGQEGTHVYSKPHEILDCHRNFTHTLASVKSGTVRHILHRHHAERPGAGGREQRRRHRAGPGLRARSF